MSFSAQGHNPVTPVRLELAAPRSRVKQSTTEPMCMDVIQFSCGQFSCTVAASAADINAFDLDPLETGNP